MPAWYGWNGRKAPEFVRHVPLAAGKIVQGSTSNLLTYSSAHPKATSRATARNGRPS